MTESAVTLESRSSLADLLLKRRKRGVPLLTPLGNVVLSLLSFIGGFIHLLFACLSGALTSALNCRLGPVERRGALLDFRETVRQMQIVSWGVIGIAVVTVTSSGMVIAMETVDQLKQFGMASAFLGGGVAYATMREMAPVLAAVVATASVGSAFTAQIASMKVTEQVDAIRSMGVSPVRFLVIPRFVAMVIMIPVVTVIADYCGVLGGFVIARAHGIGWPIYESSISNFIAPDDFVGGLIKATVFGILISLTACHMGLRTRGGAAGVGRATIASVVTCITLIYFFDTLLTALIWHV